jgi:hypothetical protein
MFYAFNEILGAVGRLETLSGLLKNRTFVDIGRPKFNNRRPPMAYASDDLQDFKRQMARRDKPAAAATAQRLADEGLTGWFKIGTGEPLAFEEK